MNNKQSAGQEIFDKFIVGKEVSGKVDLLLGEVFSLIQSKDYERGPWSSLVRLGQFAWLMKLEGISLEDKVVIDFGCGHTTPFSMGSLLYLCGAKSVMGIDFAEYSDSPDIALGIYCLVLQAVSKGLGNAHEAFNLDDEKIQLRAMNFNFRKLLAKDISGIPISISVKNQDYSTLQIADKAFDILFSSSVMEHVTDVSALLTELRREIASDGVLYAAVDLRDHRHYHDGLSPWQFLVDDDDVTPGFINKLRWSDFQDIFKQTGFKVAQIHRVVAPPPQ
jgi:SAM-dependent methyltransferase